jgi:uncharacterized protein (DUF1810 family)
VSGDFDFGRFVAAQDAGVPPAHEVALSEISAGHKKSHWIWFIFPQLNGLGQSEVAHYYAITNAVMATRYLQHEVLGPRFAEAEGAVAKHEIRTRADLERLMDGSLDAMKVISSLTMFEFVGHQAAGTILDAVGRCPLTLGLLNE